MCTETSIKYEQNKCAQKFLSSMDTKNVHRKKMMIDMMILRQNDGHSFIMI